MLQFIDLKIKILCHLGVERLAGDRLGKDNETHLYTVGTQDFPHRAAPQARGGTPGPHYHLDNKKRK